MKNCGRLALFFFLNTKNVEPQSCTDLILHTINEKLNINTIPRSLMDYYSCCLSDIYLSE